MVQISQLNISLDVMITMTFDLYAKFFLKWVDTLNILKVTRQCLLTLMMTNFWKSTPKYGKMLKFI